MTLKFSIEYFTVWGESLAVMMDDRLYPMEWGEGSIWSATVSDVDAGDLADYSYVLLVDGKIVRREWKNHSVKITGNPKTREIRDSWIECSEPDCVFRRAHQAPMFDRPGFRGAGTVVPVFSLRTATDFGIGEFNDLHTLVDWAVQTGQCIIQLLPVTDTTRKGTWKDSYPYSPVSSFALHPLYIHLQELGIRETAEFKRQQSELNALDYVDYPRVFKEKMAYVRQAYEKRGPKDLASREYQNFYHQNAEWLGEYAEFCARRDSNEPEYHAWIQFHLDRQFAAQAAYARSKGVSFKGDLPIGVSGDSADAYWHPELFNLDSCAGAPPDFFSADGQNWGFPTYNWEAMAADNYAWWKRRLRKMAQYFDAYRIDHILGFFRIWEIPAGSKSGQQGHFNPALSYTAEEILARGFPLEGLFHPDPRNPGMYQPLINPSTEILPEWRRAEFKELYTDFFYHRNDEFWRQNAMKKLPQLLDSTGMLACGEDLGMVPSCVPGVMDSERILSLEMKCMEKGRPWPYLSVCATSSHDMETLRMQFASREGRDMEPWEVRRELWDYISSPSMLAIFPIQDWVAMDEQVRKKDYKSERINEPANSDHHWRYRFHRNMEELATFSDLNYKIESMIKDGNRK